MRRNIVTADYHRNGMAGEGFYVALVEDDDGTRKLCISFENRDAFAVLDVDKAAAGNIHMYPDEASGSPGENAWRGDQYSGDLYQAIRQRVHPDAPGDH